MKNGVAVGYIDDVIVLGDFGDEVSGVKIVADGHP